MTTDENIMQEMLDRIANCERDELGVQMFCLVVSSNGKLVHKAHEMILDKIRSNEVTAATRAIALLEECMVKCGSDFQHETAKNRFLNCLIEIVSPNYRGKETLVPIKTCIMNCLRQWVSAYPEENKIQKVYESLLKGGGLEQQTVENGTGTVISTSNPESILGVDEENFTKLIKSGDPESYKRANLLLQQRVREKTRQTELLLQHKSELQAVQTTVGLLNQMLDAIESDGSKEDPNANETLSIIYELHKECKKHKVIMQRLPELIEQVNRDDVIADTLESIDLLQAVMDRYKKIRADVTEMVVTAGAATSQNSQTVSNADLLTELLGGDALVMKPAAVTLLTDSMDSLKPVVADEVSPKTLKPTITTGDKSNTTMDELSDIFGNMAKTTAASDALFANLELLEPVNVFDASANDESGEKLNGHSNLSGSKMALRELREIDQISDELFKQNLPSNDRVSSFKKEPEKITLNDLVKEKFNSKATTTTPSKNVPMPKSKSNVVNVQKTVDDSLKQNDEDEDEFMLSNEEQVKPLAPSEVVKTNDLANTTISIKPLSEISIDLDDISPTAEERLLLDDEDVKIMLNFTMERPSKHVSVIVISVVNKSKMQLKDFHFEASVKKPSKVRLLTPTDNEIAAHKPFRPPTPISQVMLLLNPTSKSVDITCIVGYKLGDDPDPIKESIVVNDIPFVE